MNRRKFFAFLPVAPLALMAEGARASVDKEQPPSEGINLTIQGTKPRNTNMSPTSIGYNYPLQDPAKYVTMSVGQDGHLWLKNSSNEWKRVVTE